MCSLSRPTANREPLAKSRFRFSAVGNVVSSKLWSAGTSKPDSWDVSVTDTGGAVPAGRVLTWQSSGASTGQVVTYDNLVVVAS